MRSAVEILANRPAQPVRNSCQVLPFLLKTDLGSPSVWPMKLTNMLPFV